MGDVRAAAVAAVANFRRLQPSHDGGTFKASADANTNHVSTLDSMGAKPHPSKITSGTASIFLRVATQIGSEFPHPPGALLGSPSRRREIRGIVENRGDLPGRALHSAQHPCGRVRHGIFLEFLLGRTFEACPLHGYAHPIRCTLTLGAPDMEWSPRELDAQSYASKSGAQGGKSKRVESLSTLTCLIIFALLDSSASAVSKSRTALYSHVAHALEPPAAL